MAVQILLTFHLPVVLCCSVRKVSWVSGQPGCFETLTPFGDSMLLGEWVVVRDVRAQILFFYLKI